MAASKTLTPEQRTQRATNAARQRWGNTTRAERRATLLRTHVRAVVDRINELTADDASQLAAALAERQVIP